MKVLDEVHRDDTNKLPGSERMHAMAEHTQREHTSAHALLLAILASLDAAAR